MSLATEIGELRWLAVLATAIILFYLFSKYWAGDAVQVWGKRLTRKDLQYIIHFFGSAYIIWLCNKYLFAEVSTFFILSLFVWTPMGFAIWLWADRKNDVFVEENTVQGEIMHHLGLIKKFAVPQTGVRLYRMPIDVYRAKLHDGTLSGAYWKKGRLIYTDYYDGSTLYHPEHPDLHNVNFYQAMAYWLKFKKDYPATAMKILELTWLREYSIVEALEQLEQKSFMALVENRMQHPVPFQLALTKEQTYKNILASVRAEKQLDLSPQEMLRGKGEEKRQPETKTLQDMEALDGQ